MQLKGNINHICYEAEEGGFSLIFSRDGLGSDQ